MKYDGDNTIVFDGEENVDRAIEYLNYSGWEFERQGGNIIKFFRWSDGVTVIEKDIKENILGLMEDLEVFLKQFEDFHLCPECKLLFRDDEVVDYRGQTYCQGCYKALIARETASKVINKTSKN